MLIKTSELSGAALDWAMAEAEGLERKQVVEDYLGGKVVLIVNNEQRKPLSAGERYSKIVTTWSWFGLVRKTREVVLGWAYEPTMCWANLREYRVSLTAPQREGDPWCAHLGGTTMLGENIGVIVCRAIVAAKLGDEVEVPDELLSAPL